MFDVVTPTEMDELDERKLASADEALVALGSQVDQARRRIAKNRERVQLVLKQRAQRLASAATEKALGGVRPPQAGDSGANSSAEAAD